MKPDIVIQPPAKITIERAGEETKVLEGVQEFVVCGLMADSATGIVYGFHSYGGHRDVMDLAAHCWAMEQRLIANYGNPAQ